MASTPHALPATSADGAAPAGSNPSSNSTSATVTAPGTARASPQATSASPPVAGTSSPPSEDQIRDIIIAFEAHDFGTDDNFRAGLPSIIKATKGRGATAAEIDDLIARAQWFYFTRLKGSIVPFETYLRFRTRETESQPMKSPTVPPRDLSPVASGTNSSSGAAGAAMPKTLAAPAIGADGLAVVVCASEALDLAAPPAASDAAVSAAEARVAELTVAAGEESVPAAEAGAATPPTPQDMKFADIVRLIAEGRADEVPVPVIPDGINESAPSVSTMKARPKPWETQAVQGQEVETETVVEAAPVDAQQVDGSAQAL